MSVETWGQMAKSADDAEKVEQAISRLIAEHEADPSAHLGAGESLEAHRANEIIDHPAGSLVNDKISYRELNFTAEAVDLMEWRSTGFQQLEYQWPTVHTYLGDSNGQYWEFYSPYDYSTDMTVVGNSYTFRWILKVVEIDTLTGRIGMGLNRTLGVLDNCFVGFKIENGVAKAHYLTDYTGGTESWLGDPVGVNDDDYHYYFVNYIEGENIIRFYIDGNLVGEYVPTHVLKSAAVLGILDLTSNASDYADIFVRKFEYSRLN